MILYMNMDVNNIIENIYFYDDANGFRTTKDN